jgi:hypothetical protein
MLPNLDDKPVATPGVDAMAPPTKHGAGGESQSHEQEGAGGEHEEGGPGSTFLGGLKAADLLHGGYEGIVNGMKSMDDLGEEAAHLLAHGGQAPAQAVGALLGPAVFAGGTVEAIIGGHEAMTSKSSEGIGNGTTEAMEGGASMFGGASTTLASIGVGGDLAAAGGPGGAAFEGGVMFGHYGDEQAKKQGMFGQGSNGKIARRAIGVPTRASPLMPPSPISPIAAPSAI